MHLILINVQNVLNNDFDKIVGLIRRLEPCYKITLNKCCIV